MLQYLYIYLHIYICKCACTYIQTYVHVYMCIYSNENVNPVYPPTGIDVCGILLGVCGPGQHDVRLVRTLVAVVA